LAQSFNQINIDEETLGTPANNFDEVKKTYRLCKKRTFDQSNLSLDPFDPKRTHELHLNPKAYKIMIEEY
jgi:hypothetical protein